MYNYNQYNRNSYSAPTTLGISERWERVLCYLGGWITGLIFLLIERQNQTVRRHASQSMFVFGVLSILGFLVNIFGAGLGHIPVVGPLFGAGFGLIAGLLSFIGFVLWIVLMVLAYVSPKTFIAGPRWERFF